MKNYKNIIIAGAVAVGLYLFLHSKKILPMTLAQKAAWHDKISHIAARMTPTERDRVYKEARKEKASAEGISEQKTRLTPMEFMLALQARAEEKLAEEEQGTGFDYIRERAPFNKAVPVEKRKHASIWKSADRIAEEKRRRKEQLAAEREEENRKRIETQKAYRDELLKNIKPKDQQGYSKKKTTEDVTRDLLLALPRSEVEHTQEYGEESEEEEEEKSTKDVLKEYVEQQKQKSKDQQGYSKKKTTEDVLRDLGLWAFP